LEHFLGEWVKKPKNASGAHKNENIQKNILPHFQKIIFT
jgi:hypothetical protein